MLLRLLHTGSTRRHESFFFSHQPRCTGALLVCPDHSPNDSIAAANIATINRLERRVLVRWTNDHRQDSTTLGARATEPPGLHRNSFDTIELYFKIGCLGVTIKRHPLSWNPHTEQ